VSGGGYHADPQAILSAKARLATVQQHAADLMKLAVDADPDWYIWGVVGAPFAAWYWTVAGELYQHLGQMGNALAEHVNALDATAQSYAATEQAIVDALRGIHDTLGR
jgi:hypothetical protein